MVYYTRTDISEGIDINKSKASKKFLICHYWYFIDKLFRSQRVVWSRCHNILVMPMNISNIAIINIKGFD